MADTLISEYEVHYIVRGIKHNYRPDGRCNTDYRPMELETNVVSHASGSTRLRLANTDILVGVKTEIDVPKLDKPDQGKIEFFVDCSANATPEFEGRGGEQLASRISSMMQRAYHSAQAFDLKQLCILEGKQCWKLFVDILILECGGNLCDAVSLAVKAALFNTRIPLVKVALMDGGEVDLQLSDDPYDCKFLNVGNAPLMITLCKIDENFIVDPTTEEEKCSVISLVMGVTGQPRNYITDEDIAPSDEFVDNEGRCTTIAMNGGSFLSLDTLKPIIELGITVAMTLDAALGDALKREKKENVGTKKHSYGFLK